MLVLPVSVPVLCSVRGRNGLFWSCICRRDEQSPATSLFTSDSLQRLSAACWILEMLPESTISPKPSCGIWSWCVVRYFCIYNLLHKHRRDKNMFHFCSGQTCALRYRVDGYLLNVWWSAVPLICTQPVLLFSVSQCHLSSPRSWSSSTGALIAQTLKIFYGLQFIHLLPPHSPWATWEPNKNLQ